MVVRDLAPLAANTTSWWIERILEMPGEQCTGWVVAQVIDDFAKENATAELMERHTFAERMAEAGMEALLGEKRTPRASCQVLRSACRFDTLARRVRAAMHAGSN